MLRYLPNGLTAFRILLVPLLVVILLTTFEGKEVAGLGVFLLAALTDFLDGWVARRFGLVTRLGKLLDPAADKILTSAAFISLVETGVAPAWMVVVIIAREFAVGALRSFAAAEGEIIAASMSGKIKTGAQIVAISLLILHTQLGDLRLLTPICLWVALLTSLWSAAEYFISHRRVLLAGAAVRS